MVKSVRALGASRKSRTAGSVSRRSAFRSWCSAPSVVVMAVWITAATPRSSPCRQYAFHYRLYFQLRFIAGLRPVGPLGKDLGPRSVSRSRNYCSTARHDQKKNLFLWLRPAIGGSRRYSAAVATCHTTSGRLSVELAMSELCTLRNLIRIGPVIHVLQLCSPFRKCVTDDTVQSQC